MATPFVRDLTAEGSGSAYRGSLVELGRASRRTAIAPRRSKLDLFRRMRAGEFPAMARRTLRAKIDMASGNINLRDRAVPHQARRAPEHRQCVAHYPMHDYAHR